MGDLILIFSVGIIIWWIFSSRKNRRSNQSGMTDTQRLWHANKAREQLENMSRDLTESFDRLDSPTRKSLQRLMAMREYIETHKRPFKFDEWLLWGIDPRCVRKYMTWAILYFGCSFLPLLWGWPVNLFFMMGFWLYLDIMFYKQELELKVTVWNPEWHEKFGENNK